LPYLIVIGALIILVGVVYRAGRRAGYESGRVDEREEWSTKIREIDDGDE
jgi:hypothetical protein